MSIKLKNENFINIQGWMRNYFDLKGAELIIFGLIYGFSQTEGNKFTASLSYIQLWTGLSKNAIITILKKLIELSLINKFEYEQNHIKVCHYSANLNYIYTIINQENNDRTRNLDTIQETWMDHTRNLDGPSNKLGWTIQETWINNNINNKLDNKIDSKNTKSEISLCNPSQTSTESSDELKPSKNKIMERERGGARPVAVGCILGEKLADIDNKKAKEIREQKAAARKNEPTAEEKINLRVKKSRMKEAQERTSNPDLLDALSKFIDSYQFSFHRMSPDTWKAILDEIFTENVNDNEIIKSINHSIASGYRKIYKPNPYKGKEDFDNTRGRSVPKALHELTQEEKEIFEANLARDEHGNLMEF